MVPITAGVDTITTVTGQLFACMDCTVTCTGCEGRRAHHGRRVVYTFESVPVAPIEPDNRAGRRAAASRRRRA